MVAYMGGKNLACRGIAQVVNTARERPEQMILDPFCGGLSTAVAFGGPVLCSDNNLALISLYKAVADGWAPPDQISPEEYEFCKTLEDEDPHKAFAGIGCSWMNRWFLRYAVQKGHETDHGVFARRFKKALLRDVPKVVAAGGTFAYASFFDYEPTKEDLTLYCDPPYAGVSGFKGAPPFEYDRFWQRCREWAQCGVPVIVSEYACPLPEEHAEMVWTMETPLGHVGGGVKRKQVEKLFWVKG